MIYKFKLKHLHCSNCANKIEKALNKQNYIKKASISVATSKLTIELAENISLQDIMLDIEKTITNVESGVKIINEAQTCTDCCIQDHKDIHSHSNNCCSHDHDNISIYKYSLKSLHCSNCATKIQKALMKNQNIHDCTISVATSTLKLSIPSNVDIDDLMPIIKNTIRSAEPNVSIIDKSHMDDSETSSQTATTKEIGTIESHNHDHGHSHDHGDSANKISIATLTIGIILFAIGIIVDFTPKQTMIIYASAYLIIGYRILFEAITGLFKGRMIDESLLMSVASLSAFFIGEYPEAVAVMLFFKIGEMMEGAAVNHSRNSISSLIDMKPDYANLKTSAGTKKVDPERINVGDYIIVKAGERVPLDGKLIDGKTTFDTSAITGESVPRTVSKDETVYSGFINKGDVVTICVTKKYSDSTIAKILDLVENSVEKKAETEKFMTKFAKYYTPTVVIIAVLIAIIPSLVLNMPFSKWLYRGALFLVVSCPCALVVSIPLCYFAGIGKSSSTGILIKGGNYLETLANLNTLVLDKTGTLTKGNFVVSSIVAEGIIDKEKLLYYAAHVESYSNHPIAKSIMSAYGKTINESVISHYTEKAGHGVEAKVDGKIVSAGNARFMNYKNIHIKSNADYGTLVYIAIDNKLMGYLVITDEIKPDSQKAIEELKSLNIKSITMLTGDNESSAKHVASKLGITNVHSNLLPDDKVKIFEDILSKTSKGKSTGFVGDGINDAPVLARADIGFSMGGLGSDAAIEASDVVLMTDELSKIPRAIKIARKTKRIIWENIIFALGIKLFVMILGTVGMANMWEAVFADVGVTVIAILNALRILNKNY